MSENKNNNSNDKTLEIQTYSDKIVLEQEPLESDNHDNGGKKMKDNKKKDKKKKTTGKKTNVFTRILAVILSTIAIGFIVGVVVVSIFITSTIATAKRIDASTFEKLNSTVVLDAEGNVIYDLGAKLIENIEYDQISQSLVDAFVSIEDSRFFEHGGFDVPRFANALLDNVLGSVASMNLSFDGGGASTIDMQLVKNVVFMTENIHTGESTLPAASGLAGIKRKVNEIYYATKISKDKILDKKVIFQKYVNEINFGAGNNMLGVQKAAKFYFDKGVSELSLIESAFLAGVVNAPAIYTPYYKLSLAKERTHTVLELMNFHGYITDDELERALTVPLENLFVEQKRNASDALPNQAYIDIVLDEVEELTGLNPATNSMVIHTAMNPKLQAELDRAQNRDIPYLDISSVNNSEMQLAATVIDNATGEVIASFGGYDYYGQRIVNRSYHSLYQPGSTVKPLISYAPAFEYLGYATSHVITDEPYMWPGTDILLSNWSRTYYGEVTLQRAISQSYNVPAVKTFVEVQEKIGIPKYRDYAEAIGFTRYADKVDDYYEAIGSTNKGRDVFNSQFAIGGNDFYTNTQELAGAVSMIMNGGDFIKPHTIREVEVLTTGEVIKSPFKATPVLSDAAAYLTAHTMRNVIDDNPYGVVERHVARRYPVYAKTGTSNWSAEDGRNLNLPSGSPKDRLLLTATDKFSIASWSGFDPSFINKKTGKAYHSEAEKSFQIQGRINGFILDSLEKQYGAGVAIKQPSSVTKISHIQGTFPYQSPIEGMNPDLITTGLVKSDYASLAPATPPTLEDFVGSDVSITQNNGQSYVNVIFEPYPDGEKLVKAPNTLEMTSGDRTFTGARLYDPSWIFGPVRYTTEVYLDGNLVETVKTEEVNQLIKVNTNVASKVKVCTFYSFELNDTASKKLCNELDMSELTVSIPNFMNQKVAKLIEFGLPYNLQLSTSYPYAGSLNEFQNIIKIKNNLNAQTAKVSELMNKTWEVQLVDHEIIVGQYIGRAPREISERYGNLIKVEIANGGLQRGAKITTITDGSGNELTKVKLSDYYNTNKKIIVNSEIDD